MIVSNGKKWLNLVCMFSELWCNFVMLFFSVCFQVVVLWESIDQELLSLLGRKQHCSTTPWLLFTMDKIIVCWQCKPSGHVVVLNFKTILFVYIYPSYFFMFIVMVNFLSFCIFLSSHKCPEKGHTNCWFGYSTKKETSWILSRRNQGQQWFFRSIEKKMFLILVLFRR